MARLPQKRDIVLRTLTAARMQKVARRVNRERVSILMYHGFRDAPVDLLHNYSGMHVDVQSFENQMRYLKSNYNVVPLDQVVDWLDGVASLPPNAVVLTMDDGYASVYRLAFPVLQRHNLPATVFVATGFLNGTHPLWTDRVRLALGRLAARQPWVELRIGDASTRFDISSPNATVRSARHLLGRMKPMANSAVRSLVEQLEKHVTEPCLDDIPDIYAAMTWEQAHEMADSGLVTIGSHTVSHSLLGRTSFEDVTWDLEASRTEIEERIARPCRTFCYPNGAIGDFDERTERSVQAAGYRCALTTVSGLNGPIANPFELRRVSVSDEDSFAEFEASVSGLRPALGFVGTKLRAVRRRPGSRRVDAMAS